jgi:hypothetical protein
MVEMKHPDYCHNMRKSICTTFVIILIYFIGSIIVFDFSKAAFDAEEDTFNRKQVAYGPRPRHFFTKPQQRDGLSYSGEEWPFLVYKPICIFWRVLGGYEKPGQWREQ